LHHIFRIVLTKHARRVAIQGPFDVKSELLECSSVAAPRAIEERIGRSSDVRPHQ
jgi:hypothetical protein